ncbi:MAG: hypothetical protein HY077_18180 [Elusimicrobia bacterium]|nr:hypothetical protein [Elusimicrobiota bacterium]
MNKRMVVLAAAFAASVGLGGLAHAQKAHDEKAEKHEEHEEHEDSGKVTGETLERIAVNLDKGLAACEQAGKPISGKFEMDDGKLQLSVYTMKAGKFSEVVVDHKTGKIAKTEAIKGGEDLAAAKAQSAAMAKAKMSLRAAVKKALVANKDFSAISVTPSLKDGHPVAEVTIGMEDDLKTVPVKLD